MGRWSDATNRLKKSDRASRHPGPGQRNVRLGGILQKRGRKIYKLKENFFRFGFGVVMMKSRGRWW